MNGQNDLVLTIIAVVAIMSLLLIVAAIAYVVGGTNSPRTDDDGYAHEARTRTAPRPFLDPAGDMIPPRGSGAPRRAEKRNGAGRLRR